VSGPLNFLDLFAGAGGLSEGFIQAGFHPLAHVEMDKAACFTLKTRMAYHWLKSSHSNEEIYFKYLNGEVLRSDLYSAVPIEIISSVVGEEITKESLSDIFSSIDKIIGEKKLDLIIGGPPCQAYSIVGRSRDTNKMVGDKRNYLYLYYAEFLKRYKPTYFVFENVTGLLSARDSDGILFLDKMRSSFKEAGYEVEYKILSSEEYGVLQKRHRVVIVGHRGGCSGFYPEPKKWYPNVTVGEVFADLPSIIAGGGSVSPCFLLDYTRTWLNESGIRKDGRPITWHKARPHSQQDLDIYKLAVHFWNEKKMRLSYEMLPEYLKSHKNTTTFRDRFKVIASDAPYSQTIMAHIAKDGHYYIHPDISQNRSITPREAARLQTFPDDYYFESVSGTPAMASAFKQIGNAVPVLLSKKLAERLIETWI
jgi:DNA (cytosine-5)-methyltransferase 1